jgi:hypothetical protein
MRVAVENVSREAVTVEDGARGPLSHQIHNHNSIDRHHATMYTRVQYVQSLAKFLTNVPSRSALDTAPPSTEHLPPPI